MRHYTLTTFIVLISLLWAGAAVAQDPPEVYSPNPMYRAEYTVEEQSNLDAAQTLFNAFATGEMDTFFALLADDVVWEINGSPELVPTHGARHGIDGVRSWLEQLEAEVELLDFGTDAFFADGDTVFVLFHDSGRNRATGKVVEQRELAMITFEDGQVSYFLCFDDSAQELWASMPESDG